MSHPCAFDSSRRHAIRCGRPAPKRGQSGSTLLMGLILLVLLTLMGLASINTATSNLKVVGNMQYQQEALGAAQAAINRVLSKASYFSDPITAPTSDNVDMNGDGINDYAVTLAQPCILATKTLTAAELAAGDVECITSSTIKSGGLMSTGAGAASTDCATVTWRLTATVNDTSTSAKVTLVQATQQKMDRILANAYAADATIRCS